MLVTLVWDRMRNMSGLSLYTVLMMLTVLWTTVPHASGTYIAWNKKVSSTTNTRVHHKAGKTNHIDRTKIKPYGPSFKHDRVSYT